MDWNDIACIIFVCVTMNHMGLVSAIRSALSCRHLPIVSCPKCLTFWSVVMYGVVSGSSDILTGSYAIRVLAISFLSSYLAVWLELAEGYIDSLYMECYDKIYATADTAPSNQEHAGSDMPGMPEGKCGTKSRKNKESKIR